MPADVLPPATVAHWAQAAKVLKDVMPTGLDISRIYVSTRLDAAGTETSVWGVSYSVLDGTLFPATDISRYEDAKKAFNSNKPSDSVISDVTIIINQIKPSMYEYVWNVVYGPKI